MDSTALIIVDMQNDFISGSLAVPGAEEILPVIEREAAAADYVFASQDWHPAEHSSFEVNGGRWPVHCVAGTWGAELHERVRSVAHVRIQKATDPAKEEFSAFAPSLTKEGWRSELARLLRGMGVRRVRVVGVATEYCVVATASDGVVFGFDTTIVRDGVRAVNDDDGELALTRFSRLSGTRGGAAREVRESCSRVKC